jgi:hypothetical protein
MGSQVKWDLVSLTYFSRGDRQGLFEGEDEAVAEEEADLNTAALKM